MIGTSFFSWNRLLSWRLKERRMNRHSSSRLTMSKESSTRTLRMKMLCTSSLLIPVCLNRSVVKILTRHERTTRWSSVWRTLKSSTNVSSNVMHRGTLDQLIQRTTYPRGAQWPTFQRLVKASSPKRNRKLTTSENLNSSRRTKVRTY